MFGGNSDMERCSQAPRIQAVYYVEFYQSQDDENRIKRKKTFYYSYVQ